MPGPTSSPSVWTRPEDDIDRSRERRRRARLLGIAAVLGPVAVWLWWRLLSGDPVGRPHLPEVDPLLTMIVVFYVAMLLTLALPYWGLGKSPHVVYAREQIDVRLSDVKGLAPVKEDVERTLELFRSARTFRSEMGGSPRRGVLFEGPPGTGKTFMAKAMAAEAGVPFLFVSATAFQSSMYGASSRKIRSYFRALRKAARAEGGAIGFIEEIDAIATTRGGMNAVPAPAPAVHAAVLGCGGLTGLPTLGLSGAGAGTVAPAAVVNPTLVPSGTGAIVNELLVQMQSFDAPSGWQRVQALGVDAVNLVLPAQRKLPRPRPENVDVLIIAATNRADSLDPALLRPGRFDRRLVFDNPDKTGRREIIDHYLARKAHEAGLDDPELRDALAGITQGYSPVALERLLDEALVNAVRRGAQGMSWSDVEKARLVTEVGLGQPVGYTDHERRLIATHEAGHAVTAWLVAPQRRLEILTIVKRAGSLGLLAHGDREDVYTRSRSELEALIQVAFGGQVAEELFFGDVSTGPSGDLQYATGVAAQMVGASGMADTLISFAAVQGSALSAENLVGRVLGDGDGRAMVEQLLRRQKEVTRSVLTANRHLVEALRDALVERHELIGHEITDVLERAGGAAPVVDLTQVSAPDSPQAISSGKDGSRDS
ncbi:MAG: AAA family ATPase [Kineosporiaceae bacterium]